MMNNLLKTGLFFVLLIIVACSKEEVPTTGGGLVITAEWLIPEDEVRDGGPGKDGIPAISSPNFSSVGQTQFLDPTDLVVAIKTTEGIRAYPHPVLDWHEIVNDGLPAGERLSLIYCPLTGTAIGWNGTINGAKTTFGVSGLLYNSNIIPYDRATDSYWSQMDHKCVKGELAGMEIETFQTIEMNFNTLREVYPNAQVLNTNTGFNRNYERYPYGDYRTNNSSLIFPVSNTDDRVASKERVLGVVIFDRVKTYRFNSFMEEEVNVIEDRYQGKDLVVIGSQAKNFLVAFENRLADGTKLTFQPIQGALPIVMEDNEGNKWDIFGEAVEGPRQGTKLPEVLNYIGYWFSWAAFNEDLEIYQ